MPSTGPHSDENRYSSTPQSLSLVSPLERFGHRAIEIINEFENAFFELPFAGETGTSE